MNRETVKTFILVVLVSLSFLLSYILWSYQPKYEMFYDANYISEADVGGKERMKSDLIRPSDIIFHQQEENEEASILGFKRPTDEYIFFKEIASWSLADFRVLPSGGKDLTDDAIQVLEIIFPTPLAADLLPSIFAIDEEIDYPNWSFQRVFMIVKAEGELVMQIQSIDEREYILANVEKVGALATLGRYDSEHAHLTPYLTLELDRGPIYIPEKLEQVTKKTLVANPVDSDLFINALFSNPSLVKPNQTEAFYTDGQRGMRIFQEGRYLEFIHPIETNDEKLKPTELMEKSVAHINEHKGWMNEYYLESMDVFNGEIQYRLHYDGAPVFDFSNLTVIEQVWREQELYQYRRSLINLGHLLNATDVSLPSGEAVIKALQNNKEYDLDQISHIRLGYYLQYDDVVHSLTLEPAWFMCYADSWVRIPFVHNDRNYEGIRGD